MGLCVSEPQIQIWIHWMRESEWGVDCNLYNYYRASSIERYCIMNTINIVHAFLIDLVEIHRFMCQCPYVLRETDCCMICRPFAFYMFEMRIMENLTAYFNIELCVFSVYRLFLISNFTKAINFRCLIFHLDSRWYTESYVKF